MGGLQLRIRRLEEKRRKRGSTLFPLAWRVAPGREDCYPRKIRQRQTTSRRRHDSIVPGYDFFRRNA